MASNILSEAADQKQPIADPNNLGTEIASVKRTLTESELAHYHREGYVVIRDFFPLDELDAINRDLDAFMQRAEYEAFKGGGENMEGWIMRLGLSTQSAADFCADDRILDLVEPVVHPGIAIYSAKLVSKEPRDGVICHWHQDDAYYTKISQSHTRMSIWVPLQDTTVEHGCLQVIPRSHQRGLQPHSKKEGARAILVSIRPSIWKSAYTYPLQQAPSCCLAPCSGTPQRQRHGPATARLYRILPRSHCAGR